MLDLYKNYHIEIDADKPNYTLSIQIMYQLSCLELSMYD